MKLTYPGTEYTADKTVDVWWYDGGELPPDAIARADRRPLSRAGQHRRRHRRDDCAAARRREPFVLPDSKMAALPTIELPERDHYGEFIDVVLGGGKQKCSANFDYAGPLTESVIIGNVAAHFPGETLKFDARSLTFSGKAGGEPVPDPHLSRRVDHRRAKPQGLRHKT